MFSVSLFISGSSVSFVLFATCMKVLQKVHGKWNEDKFILVQNMIEICASFCISYTFSSNFLKKSSSISALLMSSALLGGQGMFISLV